jgi:hypothetical protein
VASESRKEEGIDVIHFGLDGKPEKKKKKKDFISFCVGGTSVPYTTPHHSQSQMSHKQSVLFLLRNIRQSL